VVPQPLQTVVEASDRDRLRFRLVFVLMKSGEAGGVVLGGYWAFVVWDEAAAWWIATTLSLHSSKMAEQLLSRRIMALSASMEGRGECGDEAAWAMFRMSPPWFCTKVSSCEIIWYMWEAVSLDSNVLRLKSWPEKGV
jgi:hypothetical protein